MSLSTKLFAGKMRERIAITKPSGVQDSFGAISSNPSSWQVVENCWARIEAVSGKDQAAAATYVSTVSHRITIRNPREIAITTAMVVWFQTRTFQIVAVLNPNETNKMLYLLCTEINVSAGQPGTPSVS
jgi:SPP1 family predicted phage head-tail adaptor